MTKKDFFIAGLITLIASLFIFNGLASTSSPENYWEAREGAVISIEFALETEISSILVNYGEAKNMPDSGCKVAFELKFANGSRSFRVDQIVFCEDTYVWTSLSEHFEPLSFAAKSVEISILSGSPVINEIVFIDQASKKVDLTNASVETVSGAAADCENAFDEQGAFFPDSTAHELQAAERRQVLNAYKSINGNSAHKITLSERLISLGIRIFGMNPVGWRFNTALFRLLCIPLIYIIGKMLFRSQIFAGLFAGLAVLDGAGLVLSRLALGTSFSLFFGLLAVLFMLCFVSFKGEPNFKRWVYCIVSAVFAIFAVLMTAGTAAAAVPTVGLLAALNYFIALFCGLFVILSLLINKYVNRQENADQKAVIVLSIALLVSFLPLFFISFAYHYYLAVILLNALMTYCLKQLSYRLDTEIALFKLKVKKSTVAAVVVILLFMIYFVLVVFGPLGELIIY